MNKCFVCCIAVFSLFSVGSLSSSVVALPGTTWSLDNGLRVVHMEKNDSPTVTVRLYVLSGAIDEGEWLGAGISHYLEHLMVNGTTSTRTEEEGTLLLKEVGDRVNAYTSLDETCYHITTTRDHWKTAATMIADWMKNTLLVQEEVDRERDVIIQEIRMGEEDPNRVVGQTFRKLAYTVHPFRLPVIGYESLFRTITRDDLQRYMNMHYVANNMILAIVGDVSREEVAALAEEVYATIPRGIVRPRIMPEESFPLRPRSRTVYATAQQAHTILGFPTVRFGHPDRYALDVLGTILTAGRSAPLTKRLREDMRLVHQIQAGHWAPQHVHGHFTVRFSGDEKDRAAAEEEILSYLDTLREAPPDEAEIARAIRQMTMRQYYAFQSAESCASTLVNDIKLTGSMGYHAQYVDDINAVTADDLLRVAQEYLTTQRLIRAVLLPQQRAATADTASPTTDARVDDTASLQRIDVTRLPNGITCVLMPDTRLPLAHVALFMSGGVSTETADNNGVAGLTARMLTRGTPTMTAHEIAAALDARGASVNYSSGRDVFTASAQGMAEDLPFLLEMLASTLQESTFPTQEFVVAQHQAIAQARAQQERWFTEAFNNYMATVYPEHPYGMPVHGTEESIARLTAEDVVAYHTRLIQPSNMVIAVGGDICPDTVVSTLEDLFGALHATAPSFDPPPVVAPLTGNAVTEVPSTRDQATVIVGFPGARVGEPEEYIFEMIDAHLSGMGGPVFRALRGDDGLAYIAFCRSFSSAASGVFLAVGQCAPATVPDVIDRLVAAVREGTETIEDDAFTRAHAAVAVPHAISRQTLDTRVESAAQWEFFGFGAAYSTQRVHAVRNVSVEDARQMTRAFDDWHAVVTMPENPRDTTY